MKTSQVEGSSSISQLSFLGDSEVSPGIFTSCFQAETRAPSKTFPRFAGLSHSVSDIDDESSKGQWWQGGKLHSDLAE